MKVAAMATAVGLPVRMSGVDYCSTKHSVGKHLVRQLISLTRSKHATVHSCIDICNTSTENAYEVIVFKKRISISILKTFARTSVSSEVAQRQHVLC